MNPELKSIKRELLERQAELHELIRQMKADQLIRSAVYKKLESELSNIHAKLQQVHTSEDR